MFRKFTMAALAAAAFALMFCASDFSGSQAFARGGRGRGGHTGGHSVHNGRRASSRGRGFVHRGRYFRAGVPYFYAYDGYVTPGLPMFGPYVTRGGLVYSDGYYGGHARAAFRRMLAQPTAVADTVVTGIGKSSPVGSNVQAGSPGGRRDSSSRLSIAVRGIAARPAAGGH